MKHLRFQQGAMIFMVLFLMLSASWTMPAAYAENKGNTSETGSAPQIKQPDYSQMKSKYEGYSDSEYFKQMVKVYYADVSTLGGTSWAWAVAGTLIAFLSIVGLLGWIIAVLFHIYRSLSAQVMFGDTRFWKTAGMYLFVILLSLSGGLGTVILSWYTFVHQSEGVL